MHPTCHAERREALLETASAEARVPAREPPGRRCTDDSSIRQIQLTRLPMESARDILKKIRRLELKTRGLVAATFSGQYRSVFKGRGMNFEEVREYQPGDEVRSIDWNVTAKFGEVHGDAYVKKFTEERELTVMLRGRCERVGRLRQRASEQARAGGGGGVPVRVQRDPQQRQGRADSLLGSRRAFHPAEERARVTRCGSFARFSTSSRKGRGTRARRRRSII